MPRITGNPYGFDVNIADPVERIQRYIDSYVNHENYKGFEAVLMRNIRIVAAEGKSSSPGEWTARAIFELEVLPELCNPINTLHGGATALVADMATTMAAAPASSESFWEFGGVSRTLSITLLAPMPKGSVIEVDCKLVKVGKRLSLIRCEFRDKQTRELMALGEHGKVAAGEQNGQEDKARI